MNEHERAIWNAAFAAAYVAEFDYYGGFYDCEAFECATHNASSGKLAWSVADNAVAAYRHRRDYVHPEHERGTP